MVGKISDPEGDDVKCFYLNDTVAIILSVEEFQRRKVMKDEAELRSDLAVGLILTLVLLPRGYH